VQIFDSWAGIADEELFRRWVIAPTTAITKAIHASHPGVPVIGFPRGAGLLAGIYVRKAGVNALGLDQYTPLDAAAGLAIGCPGAGQSRPGLPAVGGMRWLWLPSRFWQRWARARSYSISVTGC